jgi:hypothetical protein
VALAKAVLLLGSVVSLVGKGRGISADRPHAHRQESLVKTTIEQHVPLEQERSDMMEDESVGSMAAIGIVFYAAMMLIIAGIFQAVEGFIAIINDNFYARPNSYAFTMQAAVWGWIHIILGLLITAAGIYLFTGKLWARLIGIAAAVLSAVANFLFIPYYPIWSTLVLVLDLLAIWALAFHGRDLAEMAGLDE